MKRFQAVLLAVLLVLAASPQAPALAQEARVYASGDYRYTLNADGTAVVTGYTGLGGVAQVPGTLDGHPVTAIGSNAFYGCDGLASITLPDGLQSIGASAFEACGSLASITLPEGLREIGDDAFWNCTDLTSLTLPKGLRSIGNGAFFGCCDLASITLPDGLLSIGNNAFNLCESLASLTLPEGLLSIGGGAFYECGSLAALTLPESLTFIGEEAIQKFDFDEDDLDLTVTEGSYAETWVKENGFTYGYPDAPGRPNN